MAMEAGDPQMTLPLLAEARRSFHAALFERGLLRINDSGVPSIADSGSSGSKAVALELFRLLGQEIAGARLKGQIAGATFEKIVEHFLAETFPRLGVLRCGSFRVLRGAHIDEYDQYDHLAAVRAAARLDPNLRVVLGGDYLIKPDVVVLRDPESDEAINADVDIVDDTVARLSSIRRVNNAKPILHASISCKLTLRSDRAQNARSEALNLIRNRKGRLPHTAVVTAEPTSGRIASLALGTGDIDCVYHIALNELREATARSAGQDSLDLLDMMVSGKRLKDIGDLPLDLAV